MKTEKSFMSLSKISYGYDLDPKWAADKWLAEPTTLEFIQLWESLHNLSFDNNAYLELCSNALSVGASVQVEEMQHNAHVSGIFVDKAFDGDIFLHKDLAMDFTSWASPSFRTFCLVLLRNGNLSTKYNFNSEEDFIISSKTLAKLTQQQALKNYKKYDAEFVYNCHCV